MSSITCSEVSYRYGRKAPWVLVDFSHTFEEGITLLQGYSGCGKSTLLRLIAGYLKPTNGNIKTDWGVPFKNNKLYREGLGFVFQQINLLPLANIQRNLELAGALSGMSSKELKNNIAYWLKHLGLQEYAKRLPKSLSGGQQQRAAIARSLIKKPQIAIFDEPTSGLDDFNTTLIAQVLHEYAKEGKIVIIATHDHRLFPIGNEILDFNINLPSEGHLESLV